jgi:MEDS: MEthanogen/methylotroph, DcmR Sensory domain
LWLGDGPKDRDYRTPAAALEGLRDFYTRGIAAGAPWVSILGEPVLAGATRGDARAWARYESLLNLVFSCAPVTVLCPYDTGKFDAAVIEQVRASHTLEHEAVAPSRRYLNPCDPVLEP